MLLALGFVALPAVRAGVPDPSAWRLWLEPSYMRDPGAIDIPGAHRTQIAPGVREGAFLRPLTRAEAEELQVSGSAFQARVRENAAADLAAATVTLHRDKRHVVTYAELRSVEGLVASAVLAPGFLDKFAELFGPSVLVLVPNRTVAYVFPKLASTWSDYSDLMLAEYGEARWPVSLEIFEIGPEGIKATGAFRDPGRD